MGVIQGNEERCCGNGFESAECSHFARPILSLTERGFPASRRWKLRIGKGIAFDLGEGALSTVFGIGLDAHLKRSFDKHARESLIASPVTPLAPLLRGDVQPCGVKYAHTLLVKVL